MSEPGEKPKGFTVTDRRGQSDDERHVPPSSAPAQSQSASSSSPEAGGGGEAGRPLPEIDFSTFVMSLATSALVHLGELVHPDDPSPRTDLPLAQQTIDILGLLADKTRGNLTADEDKLLTTMLLDLRMKFVDARKRAAQG